MFMLYQNALGNLLSDTVVAKDIVCVLGLVAPAKSCAAELSAVDFALPLRCRLFGSCLSAMLSSLSKLNAKGLITYAPYSENTWQFGSLFGRRRITKRAVAG